MFTQFGKYILLLKQLFTRPENLSMYWKETTREMVSIGIGSLGIVSIIAVFLGAVTCVQTAFQLVSGLVPITIIGTIVRDSAIVELSPTITCLVLVGKVGSNIASEIGTMRVTEQIDALEIMGVNPAGYLILPKVIASLVTIPLLIIISMGLAISGGLIAGHLSGAINYTDYLDGIRDGFIPLLLVVAMVKAVIFAFIISTVSAYFGFYTNGGALEVGRSSTKSVVYGSIYILCTDYIVAQVLL
ncbi:MAG: phospholipid/cholesterol/gamma-HCH transport system permease protein [Sphingobacteriales bacterium]|jgi:phospholipid/cholesterol/gamma-HCH transport system permease protein